MSDFKEERWRPWHVDTEATRVQTGTHLLLMDYDCDQRYDRSTIVLQGHYEARGKDPAHDYWSACRTDVMDNVGLWAAMLPDQPKSYRQIKRSGKYHGQVVVIGPDAEQVYPGVYSNESVAKREILSEFRRIQKEKNGNE